MNFRNISGKYRQSSCMARWKQKLLQTQQRNLEANAFNLWNKWLLCLPHTCLAILDTDHRGGSASKRWKTLKYYWVVNIFENRSLSLGMKRLQDQGGTHGNSTRDIWKRKRRFLAGKGKNSLRDRQILSKHKLVVTVPNAKVFWVHGKTKKIFYCGGVCPKQTLLQTAPGLWAEQSTAQSTAENVWANRAALTGIKRPNYWKLFPDSRSTAIKR